jgi:hypothetical protein
MEALRFFETPGHQHDVKYQNILIFNKTLFFVNCSVAGGGGGVTLNQKLIAEFDILGFHIGVSEISPL